MAATVSCSDGDPLGDICVKWGGKEYKIAGLHFNETVKSLKDAIYKTTGVLPDRQKLMGIKYKGRYHEILGLVLSRPNK